MNNFEIRVPKGAVKAKKRVGRGRASGLGTTAGRGTKGQNARNTVKPGFEGGQMPLFRRLPARGFSNAYHKKVYVVLGLDDLEAKFNNGDVVDFDSLLTKKLVRKSDKLVKVLANGELTKKLNVKINKISAAAKEVIEKLGGTVSIIE